MGILGGNCRLPFRIKGLCFLREAMIIRYYSFKCPRCGQEYTNRMSRILLGTGKRRCRTCEEVFNDGCKEWPELTRSEKFDYFLPTTTLGFVAGALIMAAIAIYISKDDLTSAFSIAGFILLMFAAPWIPFFLLQWRHVPKSKARFERRRAFGNSDEFVL
jgi:hypothetical protein